MDQNPDPQQILRSFDEISALNILLICGAAWLLVAVIHRGIPWLADRLPARFRFYLLPIAPVLRLLILGATVLQVTTMLIQPTPQNLLAILGGSALAIGFAFKDYASSIVAGIVALYEQPYRAGDWVTIGSDYGEVQSVGLRALKILRPDDSVVTVPHARIWQENIANANNGKRDHMCIAHFYLSPGHDAAFVRNKLYDVAVSSPFIHLDRPIRVIVTEEPWATHYHLKAYPIDGRDEFLFISDLTVRGKAAMMEHEIPSAQVPPALQAQSSGPQSSVAAGSAAQTSTR